MSLELNRLKEIGFEAAGKWLLSGSDLKLQLDEANGGKRDVLYAFVVDGTLRYIGKTASLLKARLQGYKTPPSNSDSGASTNIKNHRHIVEALSNGSTVEIYVLHGKAQQQHGDFVISLAAGLEDSLIGALSPLWNGRALASYKATVVKPVQSAPAGAQSHHTAQRPASISEMFGLRGPYPTASTLLDYARSIWGQELQTLQRGTPFQVGVDRNVLEIMPGNSLTPRRETYDRLVIFLDQLRETNSFQMSDYQKLSFNASYVLALVRHWQRAQMGVGNV